MVVAISVSFSFAISISKHYHCNFYDRSNEILYSETIRLHERVPNYVSYFSFVSRSDEYCWILVNIVANGGQLREIITPLSQTYVYYWYCFVIGYAEAQLSTHFISFKTNRWNFFFFKRTRQHYCLIIFL